MPLTGRSRGFPRPAVPSTGVRPPSTGPDSGSSRSAGPARILYTGAGQGARGAESDPRIPASPFIVKTWAPPPPAHPAVDRVADRVPGRTPSRVPLVRAAETAAAQAHPAPSGTRRVSPPSQLEEVIPTTRRLATARSMRGYRSVLGVSMAVGRPHRHATSAVSGRTVSPGRG